MTIVDIEKVEVVGVALQVTVQTATDGVQTILITKEAARKLIGEMVPALDDGW